MAKKLLLLTFFICISWSYAQDLHTDSNAVSVGNESNSTVGWAAQATLTTDNTDVQSGNFSFRVVSTANNGRLLEYVFNATVGVDYTIRIWAKEGDTSNSPAFANWLGMNGFATTPIVGTAWTEYVFNVTATSTTPTIRVYTSPFSQRFVQGNTVLIDAVSIIADGSDTESPTAVSDLTSSNTTSTTTVLNWSAATDNVGVTNYEIFQDGVSIANTGTTTSFNVTGLAPSTSYDFTVFAEDAAGNVSTVSNTETVNTDAAPDVQAPTAVSDLSSSNTTTTTTDLSWSAATDNVGVTNYEVFQDGVSIANTGTTTSFNVTGLAPSTSYDFTVFAEDAAGNVSTVSNTETVNTLGIPDTEAPTAVSDLTSNNTTSTTTVLNWSAATDNVGVTNYEIFQDGVSIANTGTTTSFNVTGLAPSTSYDFTVFAEDAAGNVSTVSNTETVLTEANTGIVDYTSENANLNTVDWIASNLYADQNVGIGTTNTHGYRLAVAGNVIAEGVRVELQTNWPDFVFESDYDLPQLDQVRAFIAANGHLPNVPSAKQVENDGIDLGSMDAKLLQKIEELTLYLLSQESQIKELKRENSEMKELLKNLLSSMENQKN
ncbi:fibronectin type III domain-containing protein [Flagellimonas marina]|uniref:Fibronectin type III domain-containing protein n=1 Tax=Flagellimonas marina TaxID=1775168 RepID=A0ABV8PJZ7_9FLAO